MGSEIRVAAIKAHANRMVEDWEGPQVGSKPAMIAVMRDLLAALAAAEAARDQARQDRTRLGLLVNEWRNSAEAAEARATRLAALEQAAREIAILWPSDPKLWAWEEVEALVDAVRNLAAPPGEEA